MASNLSSSKVFKLTRGTATDSVCVTKLGMIAKRCGL
jgi:hypothetical protein